MNGFYRQLVKGVAVDFKDLDFSHPTVRHSFKTAVAAILACFIALNLQTDQPYWAGVSAFVVMQRTVGATIYKSILRIGGTVSGALLGLILASLLVEHHLIFVLVVTMIAFCGIYLTTVFKRHVYAWLFLYITALLVLVGGLDNPTPEAFIHLAFYRSFEIVIGILVGLFVSNVLFVQYAKKQVSDAVEDGFTEFEKLNNAFFDQLTSPKNNNSTEYFDRCARSLMDQLFDLDNLLDLAGQESRYFSKLVSEQKKALGLRRMAEIILYCHRENVLHLGNADTSVEYGQALQEIKTSLKIILQASQINSTAEQTTHPPTSEFARLNEQILAFEKIYRKDQLDRFDYIQIIQCFRLLSRELAFSFFPASLNHTGSVVETRELSHLFSGFYFDPYNFKFALAGAIAILTVPFIWLYLGLPGYSQIIISIVACITLTTGSTSFKGYLRLSGCVVGAVITFLILGLNIENLVFMLSWLFLVAFFCGLIFFGEPNVSYFGIQCFLVVVVGLVGDLSPAQSIGPPFERLLGIILGVLSLIFFQKLIAPSHPKSHLQHLVRQSNHATKEVCDWVFRNPDTLLARLDHWQNRRLFANLASSIREFESFDNEGDAKLLKVKEDVVTNYRYLLHNLYGYILAQTDLGVEKSAASDLILVLVGHIKTKLSKENSLDDVDSSLFLAEMAEHSKKQLEDLSPESETALHMDQVFVTEISLIRILKRLHQAEQLELSLR